MKRNKNNTTALYASQASLVRLHCMVCFFCFLSMGPCALAQIPDTVFIPSVAVQSSSNTASKLNELEDYVLEDPNYQNLGEALASNANLFVKSYGIGSMATLSIRGSGSAHTKLLWNGIDMNASTTGIADLSLYPTLFMDGVDVLYGNNSLGLCAGALGGAVNMKNNLRFVPQQRLEFNQQVGSFGQRTSQLKYAQGNDKWQSETRIFLRNAQNDFQFRNLGEEGFPMQNLENAALKQSGIMQTVAHRPNEKTLLSARFWYFNSDRELPPMFTLDNINERQIDESFRLLVNGQKYIGNGKVSWSQAWLKSSLSYEHDGLAKPSIANMQSHKSVATYQIEQENSTFNFRLNVDFDQALHQSLSKTINRTTVGPYAQWEKRIGSRWRMTFSNRLEWIMDDALFMLPSASLEYQQDKEHNWTAFVKVARNVKYPSINDLYWSFGGNENLRAELSEGLDLGFDRTLLWKNGWKIQLRSNFYLAEIEDYIQWVPTQFGYWQAKNVRKVQLYGIESVIKASKAFKEGRAHFFFNHTWSRSINRSNNFALDGSANKQLVYVPENQVNARLNLEYKNIVLVYKWQFVSERYTLSDNSKWLSHFQLSDISISKRWVLNKHRFLVSFSVINLLNEEYQTIVNRPMPFRNYQISLTLKFKK